MDKYPTIGEIDCGVLYGRLTQRNRKKEDRWTTGFILWNILKLDLGSWMLDSNSWAVIREPYEPSRGIFGYINLWLDTTEDRHQRDYIT